jgi:hypothetical protein
MKAQSKMTITTFGAAGALALIVGLGAPPVAAAPAPAPATHSSSSVAPVAPNAEAPGTVHNAVLTACISGLNCG